MRQVTDMRDMHRGVDATVGHEPERLCHVPGSSARRTGDVRLAVVDEASVERDVLAPERQTREQIEHPVTGHEPLRRLHDRSVCRGDGISVALACMSVKPNVPPMSAPTRRSSQST